MPARFVTACLLPVAFFAVLLRPHEMCGQGAASDPAVTQAAALVRQMTLDEKVAQMQNEAPRIERLGIAEYDWWNEALHGVARSGFATVFPQAIGMAATWDAPMMERIGDTVSLEARAKFNHAQQQGNRSINYGLTMWAPNINIDRDPRWGRGQETFGEDPQLTGTLAAAYVRGLQGPDPAAPRVDATAKHFAVHSGPEALRHNFDATVSAHDLYDTYLPAFRHLVVDAHVNAVMCAYNRVGGKPACASDTLLQKILRKQWGFKGYVVSDCNAVTDIAKGHAYAPDMAFAAAVSLHNGTDLSCGKEYGSLLEAVRKGIVLESDLDAALTRLLAARIRLGLIGEGHAKLNAIPYSENDSPEHRQLALAAARSSIVLLKNERSVLPLASTVKTLAVVGPNARSLAVLEGNYNAVPSQPSFPLEALEARTQVIYAQGAPLAEGFPIPVPTTVFSHTEQGRQVAGLRGEYFNGNELKGTPQIVRTDRAIDFDWNAATPDPAITPQAFAVRWSGNLTMPVAGTYTFAFQMAHCSTCDDAETVRVWLDGKQVYEFVHAATHGRRAPTPRFNLAFADAAPHAVRMEYTHSAPHFGAGLSMNWLPPVVAEREEALRAAAKADAVVAFLGLSPELEGEEMPIHIDGFDGGDRTSIELPQAQADLVHALAATGKPLVVVLMSGSAIALGEAGQRSSAILEAWYPGEAGGEAIADILMGKVSPSAKLPVTFYAATSQLAPFASYEMQGRTYRYFNAEPAYGFGYGLSYASFHYAQAKLSGDLSSAKPVELAVEVTNTSTRAADEVVECYLVPTAAKENPLRKLVAFEKLHLDAGETRTAHLQLSARALSLVDAEGRSRVAPGDYKLYVGSSQPNAVNVAAGQWLTLHVQQLLVLEP